MLSSKPDDCEPKLVVMFCHDRSSKAVHAIPTERQGGPSLSYLVTEAARFVCWLGYGEVRIRSDNEPAVLSFVHHLQKALHGLGIGVSDETSPVGSHASNGALEQALKLVRQKACVHVSQLEAGCGVGGVFKAAHPIFQRALVHAAWSMNRFRVVQNHTAFELITASAYRGKISMPGEQVLGFLQSEAKAAAWVNGVWLGKSVRNDVRLIGTPQGVYVTRSARRLETPWNVQLASDISTCVWEHGLASLGSQLVLAIRIAPPVPEALPLPEAPGLPPPPLPLSPVDVAGSDPPSTPSGSSVSDATMQTAQSTDPVVGPVPHGSGASIPANGGDVSRLRTCHIQVLCSVDVPMILQVRSVSQDGESNLLQVSHEGEAPERYFDASCVESMEADELIEKDDEPLEMNLDEQQQRLMFPRVIQMMTPALLPTNLLLWTSWQKMLKSSA